MGDEKEMTIRKMTAADYDRVYALWMSCKNMGFNDVDDSRAGIEKFLRRNPDTSFVAEENGEIIGVVLGGQDGRRGYIYHMSVAETHRRQGVAGQLLTGALRPCGKKALPRWRCWCSSGTKPGTHTGKARALSRGRTLSTATGN